MIKRRVAALVVLMILIGATPLYVWSQEDAYEPYRPEEFPEWAHTARRFETIFFGALPITFFFSSLGFDLYAYSTNGFSQEYLPLFFGNSPEKEQFTQDTLVERIGVSISLSLVIAIIDLIIDKRTDAEN